MDFSKISEKLKITVDGALIGQITAYNLEKNTTDPENLLPYIVKVTLRLHPSKTQVNFFSNTEHTVVISCNGITATYKKCKVLKLQEEWGNDQFLYRTVYFYAATRE